MNAILGWLSLLQRGEAIKDPQHAIEVIQRNANLQAKLIEDLLEMNRLASGTVRLEIAPMDVGSTVHAAVDSLKPTAEAKHVRLSVEVEPGLPMIYGDVRRVQQILWNLVHNAVKFTGADGSVQVRVDHGEGLVRVLVKDNGRGIAADFLPYVFDRFRQADPSPDRGATWGLGIGLSTARHLAELHGGSIQAASPGLNQGSTFIVELPVHQHEGVQAMGTSIAT
jgi:signal transduction histidine kinase